MSLPAHFELHFVFLIISGSSVNSQTVLCNAVHFNAVCPIAPGPSDSNRLYHPVERWQTQSGSYFDPTSFLYTTFVHSIVSVSKRGALRCEYNATSRRFREFANEVTQGANHYLLFIIHRVCPIPHVRLTVWGGGEIESEKDFGQLSKSEFEESGCSIFLNIAADRQPQWERDFHSASSQSVSQHETCNASNGTNNRSRPIILSFCTTEVIVSSIQFLGVVSCGQQNYFAKAEKRFETRKGFLYHWI